MDLKVLEVQKWLNLTYGNHPDFPAVTEDGLTGNSTIKALIRGLQIEAGVKVDGVLGSGSLAAIGTISPSLDTSVQTNRNKVYIAQGGLYCKGYNPKGFDGIYGSGMIEKVREFETDAGFISTTGNITPKLLKAILNTENFRLDEEKGDHQIRTIQQALNRSYSNYMDLMLKALDIQQKLWYCVVLIGEVILKRVYLKMEEKESDGKKGKESHTD